MIKTPFQNPEYVGDTKEDCRCYFCGQREPVTELKFKSRAGGKFAAVHSTCDALTQKFFYRKYKAILDIERDYLYPVDMASEYRRALGKIEIKLNNCAQQMEKYKIIFGVKSLTLLGEYEGLTEEKNFIVEKMDKLVVSADHPRAYKAIA